MKIELTLEEIEFISTILSDHEYVDFRDLDIRAKIVRHLNIIIAKEKGCI